MESVGGGDAWRAHVHGDPMSQESSAIRSQVLAKVVQKDCSAMSIVVEPMQEFAFHGCSMRGPARSITKAGTRGRHKQNAHRDLVRKAGRVAP